MLEYDETDSVSPESFQNRIDALGKLRNGTHREDGKVFQPADLMALQGWLERLVATHNLSFPSLNPLVPAAVFINWEPPGWDVNLTVDFKSRTLWFLAQNEVTHAEVRFAGTVFDADATTNIDGFFAEITTNQKEGPL